MRALADAGVVESRHPDYRPGEIVTGWFGWQECATVDANAVIRRVVETDLPPTRALGVLGLNGLTARVDRGTRGRFLGCRAVGIAGGPDGVRQRLDVFGYDAAIGYKSTALGDAIDKACPDGVNVYFDNTSGVISDAVYPRFAVGARVVICGAASIPSGTRGRPGRASNAICSSSAPARRAS